MENIVVFGGSGQVGSAIAEEYANDKDIVVYTPSHNNVDITIPGQIDRYIKLTRPNVVINCTAFHELLGCEANPDRAFLMNATIPGQIAAICHSRDIKFIHFSTDYVFDGEINNESAYTEKDIPRPINYYGISKLAGEYATLRYPKTCIIRTASVYSKSGKSNKGPILLERLIEKASRGEEVSVVQDVSSSPTYAPHLAQGVRDLLNSHNPRGIYHMAGALGCTWNYYIRYAFSALGLPTPLPIESTDKDIRPRRTVLQSTRIALPQWQEGLKEYLAQRNNNAPHRGDENHS